MKAIMKATLKEALRKKTFTVMTILVGLYLILWTILLYYFGTSTVTHGMGAQFKPLASVMFTQMGLQFSSMLLSLLTIMLSSGSIASELENGMVHAVLSRPIKRSDYVLGKFLGLFCLVSVYATVLFSAILLIGAAFSLETVLALSFTQIIGAWFFYLLVPLCLLCVTLYGSTLIKTIPCGLLMIFVYILGNIGGMVEMIGNYINNSAVISSGILISLVSPFHTLYNEAQRILLPAAGVAGDLMRGMGGLSGGGKAASPAMFVYIGIYSLVFVLFAVRKFNKTDIA